MVINDNSAKNLHIAIKNKWKKLSLPWNYKSFIQLKLKNFSRTIYVAVRFK